MVLDLSLYWAAVVIGIKHLTYTYLFRISFVFLVQCGGSSGSSPRLAVTSRLRWFSRYEEREEVVYDVSCGDACDVSVIVCGCDFDDVCATG
jgi:hypothetical protein